MAINHCIDLKSYNSLHTLVNDMFPPTSMVEQVFPRCVDVQVSGFFFWLQCVKTIPVMAVCAGRL